MNRFMPYGLLAAVTMLAISTTASAFGPCCCFCKEGRCQVKVDKEEVDVPEFTCKCETICVPPLRFPWECGPLKKCGKVRQVKVLGSEKSKETICTYDWSAVHCCPACRVKVRASCGCGCCGACHGGDSCTVQPCFIDSECAQMQLPTPATSLQEESADAVETEAFSQRYPEVNVAMLDAIRTAKPDADGWVSLSNHASDSLSANIELIEATE